LSWTSFFPGADYRSAFMEEVHDLAFHGQGGFPISEVWDLPIAHRRYHIKMIIKYREQQQEQIDQAKGKTPMGKKELPQIPVSKKPTYTTNIKS